MFSHQALIYFFIFLQALISKNTNIFLLARKMNKSEIDYICDAKKMNPFLVLHHQIVGDFKKTGVFLH